MASAGTILATFHALVAQTCHRHARDVVCQRFGISRADLARLVLAERRERQTPDRLA